jgi:hypothetical protein
MRESRTSGSVRGALSNERPYREYLVWTTARVNRVRLLKQKQREGRRGA